ncbi:c-type cytochrome [Sulfurimonas sp.]
MRFIFIFFIFLSFAHAKTPYEMGKELYLQKTCFSCHGNKAEGMHNYPRLANRAKGYLSYKLQNFRKNITSSQQQEMMVAFALGLSDDDIEALVTFLSEYKEDEMAESYDDSFDTAGDGGS